MASSTTAPLYIPVCIHNPPDRYHLPPHDQPLRIQIEGPLIAIQRLLPHISWRLDLLDRTFPQPAGLELARLTFQKLYGQEVCTDLVVRDEYLGWMPEKRPDELIDYYGVTFDHLVPADDCNPVLQLNIIEIEDDNGAYANTWLLFAVDPMEFIGKKVLAVPRCCQKRKGTQDRWRVNALVHQRDCRNCGDFPLQASSEFFRGPCFVRQNRGPSSDQARIFQV